MTRRRRSYETWHVGGGRVPGLPSPTWIEGTGGGRARERSPRGCQLDEGRSFLTGRYDIGGDLHDLDDDRSRPERRADANVGHANVIVADDSGANTGSRAFTNASPGQCRERTTGGTPGMAAAGFGNGPVCRAGTFRTPGPKDHTVAFRSVRAALLRGPCR